LFIKQKEPKELLKRYFWTLLDLSSPQHSKQILSWPTAKKRDTTAAITTNKKYGGKKINLLWHLPGTRFTRQQKHIDQKEAFHAARRANFDSNVAGKKEKLENKMRP